MLKPLIFLLICFLSPVVVAFDNESLQAYLSELVEKKVVSEKEMLDFHADLENGNLVNPIRCHPCLNSVQLIHKPHLDFLLKTGDYDLANMNTWTRAFLQKRGHDTVDRVAVQNTTKALWKHRNAPLSLGAYHFCAIRPDRTVICNAEKNENIRKVPKDLGKAISVATCAWGACAVNEDGELKCWGESMIHTNRPENLPQAVQVTCAYEDICILDILGQVTCWSTSNLLNQPKAFPNEERYTQVHGFGNRMYVVTESGKLLCSSRYHNCESEIPDDLKAVSELSGDSYHNCTLQKDGDIRCWHSSEKEENKVLELRPVIDLKGVVSHLAVTSLGETNFRACALDSNGKLLCWSDTGKNPYSLVPKDLGKLVGLFSGHGTMCGLEDSGNLRCWGRYPGWRPPYPPLDLKVLH